MKTIDCTELPELLDEAVFYKLLSKNFDYQYYLKRTDRNIGWITKEEQEMLHKSVIAIAGCGGMGGVLLEILLRLGVGEIRIADGDRFDESNLNRQYGASAETVGKQKASETAKKARKVIGDTTVIVYTQGITEETVEDFVKGCDIVCDEIEFWAVASRILLHQAVRRQPGIVLLNSPTVGHQMYVTKFTADSMTIEEVLGLSYEQALPFQQKVQNRTATLEEVDVIMKPMVSFVAPQMPEYSVDIQKYSTRQSVLHRLKNETTASIIATNPPMATGYLANQILFHLLQQSAIKRTFVLPPPMPGYIMIDAGTLETKRFVGKWWIKNTVIRPAYSPAERMEAFRYIKGKYYKLFGTLPGKSDVYLTAKHDGIITGVVALELVDEDEQLPLEIIYQVDRSSIMLPTSLQSICSNNSAQIGRWIADSSLVADTLTYASSVYANSLGKLYGWANHTEAVHRRLTSKGIIFFDIPGASLCLDHVLEHDRAFYTNGPIAKPYVVEFSQMAGVFENQLASFTGAGVVFEL